MSDTSHVKVIGALGAAIAGGTLQLPRLLAVVLPAFALYGIATVGTEYLLVDAGMYDGRSVLAPDPAGVATINLVGSLVEVLLTIPLSVALYKAFLEPGRWTPYFALGRTELRMLGAFLLVCVIAVGIVIVLSIVLGILGSIGFFVLKSMGVELQGIAADGLKGLPPGVAPAVAIVLLLLALVAFWSIAVVTMRLSIFTVDIVARDRFAFGEAWAMTRGEGWRLFWLVLGMVLVNLVVVGIFAFAISAIAPAFIQAIGEMAEKQVYANPYEALSPAQIVLLVAVAGLGLLAFYGVWGGALVHAYNSVRPRIDSGAPPPGVRGPAI
ncbi:MAG: hypothetical protein H6923_03965 [Alphaproteobacteria bacterium]|nr:hypothetical protein [Alphaproteobacteria bacterium]